jgi:quercetin dioxygenase-like cupin family protein
MMAVAALIAGSGVALNVASAQQSGITRTDVVRHDLGVPGREVIQVRVDFSPGVAFGKHSHPGAEVAYVLEGSLEYQFEGEPPVTLDAGQALFIPAGTIHAARNVGSRNAAELATYIVEKGKPLVVLTRVGRIPEANLTETAAYPRRERSVDRQPAPTLRTSK